MYLRPSFFQACRHLRHKHFPVNIFLRYLPGCQFYQQCRLSILQIPAMNLYQPHHRFWYICYVEENIPVVPGQSFQVLLHFWHTEKKHAPAYPGQMLLQ